MLITKQQFRCTRRHPVLQKIPGFCSFGPLTLGTEQTANAEKSEFDITHLNCRGPELTSQIRVQMPQFGVESPRIPSATARVDTNGHAESGVRAVGRAARGRQVGV